MPGPRPLAGASKLGCSLWKHSLLVIPRSRSTCTGSVLGDCASRYIDHGLCTPDELNAIYNRCFAGLSLSLTNVSLVPHEMLSAGCIPVVNDAQHNRVVLDNDHVVYAPPSPAALAAALSDVVN